MPSYDEMVTELHQVPLAQFVAERKRLAMALKAAGDKDGSKRLMARPRPPVSAWAVNQLYWHARDAFEQLMAAAARLRAGELAASAAHRAALARLRERAATIVADGGHAVNEATLRRVAQTLAAIAAAGGWDPDLPGALGADREPPGFEAAVALAGLGGAQAAEAGAVLDAETEQQPAPAHRATRETQPAETTSGAGADHERIAAAHERERQRADDQRAAEAEQQRAHHARAAEAEQQRADEARKATEIEQQRRAAERHRLEAALRAARADLAAREREAAALEAQLRAATGEVDDARRAVDAVERELAALATGEPRRPDRG